MRNKHNKKLQRDVNIVMRGINKSIYNDELWLSRFYGHQVRADYYDFEDKSGGTLTFWIEFVDKKTNFTKTFMFDYFGDKNFLSWEIFTALNDFIVKDCAAWENEDPRDNIIDFRER